MYDGSNRKHIRQAEKRAKLDENNDIAYLRQIMGTLPGRAWMYRLLTDCQMFHEPFSPHSPYATAYNCGRQSVGRRLFDNVFSRTPSEYALMMQEAQAKEAADAARNASTEQPGSTDPRWYTEGSAGYGLAPDGTVADVSADTSDGWSDSAPSADGQATH